MGTRKKGGVGRRRKREEKEGPFEEGSVGWLVLCQLGRAIVILEEEASIEEMPQLDWPGGKSVGHFFLKKISE